MVVFYKFYQCFRSSILFFGTLFQPWYLGGILSDLSYNYALPIFPGVSIIQGSEGEALLATIKGIVKCYHDEFPKDLMWKNQLQRLEKFEATSKDL